MTKTMMMNSLDKMLMADPLSSSPRRLGQLYTPLLRLSTKSRHIHALSTAPTAPQGTQSPRLRYKLPDDVTVTRRTSTPPTSFRRPPTSSTASSRPVGAMNDEIPV